MPRQWRAEAAGSSGTRCRPAPDQPTPRSLPTILLSVAGLTPQVITETLYCLVRGGEPQGSVREVRVVTTRAGEARVRELLLHPRDGWFHRFCREFGLPPGSIRFDHTCIQVPAGPEGMPLEDVRTPTDNALVADCILSLVRDLTRDPEISLHCSVAGGRKTMGLFLGIAFQFFARPQDRLSHVLVWPPEMEGQPDFFYPPPRPTTYEVSGRPIRSDDIRVELAEIPVLLLRERVQAAGLETRPYTALIGQAQQELDRLTAPPPLLVDSPSRSLRIDRQAVSLTQLEFAVYRLLARRRVEDCGRPACPGCPACSVEAKQFLERAVLDEIRAGILRLGARDERTRALVGWQSAGHDRFLEVRSRINHRIREALGPGQWVCRYCISAHRQPGALTRYFIPVDPSQIILG